MWWSNLHTLQQIMFIVGCAMGAVLIVQILMMLIGMGHDTAFDHDGDVDSDADAFNHQGAAAFGMKLLSIRSVIAFLGVGAWVCFTLLEWLQGPWLWLAIVLSAVVGFGASCLMSYAMMSIEKLQQSGNVAIGNAVGKNGEVYLRIPENRKGNGKIQVTVQERLCEYAAVTDVSRILKTGEKIRVTGVVDENTLLVEPF